MQYLDLDQLSAIDTAAFQAQQPYPWINPERLLTEEGYQRLLNNLPDQTQFTPSFGNQRAHGQQGHDRFILEYSDDLPVVQEWKDFVAELRSPTYQTFLSRLLGTRAFELSFHWHYTPRGCGAGGKPVGHGVEPDAEGTPAGLQAVGPGHASNSRKFCNNRGPSGVRNDSGWNWTPKSGRLRCRTAMHSPRSAVRAVISSSSGMRRAISE